MINTAPPLTFEVSVPVPQLTKGEREYRAFLRLLPQLLAAYRGQFVAIHEEKVVDSDINDIVLIQRTHSRFGYVPIHVGLVTDPLPIVSVPHYREYRSPGDGR